jgi:hypothetical protein
MRELFLTPPRPRVDPVIPQNKPVYRVLDEHGFFGPDDTLHPEGSLIVLHDLPNENMEPMNDLAREKFEEMLDGLEESARKVAEANGRHFAGRPRSKEDMIAHASEDARKATAIMGAKLDVSSRIESVTPAPVPEPPLGANSPAKSLASCPYHPPKSPAE